MASLVELFEFLSSPNPQARQIALSNLAGHTAKSDAQRHIFIPSLLAPVGRDLAEDADVKPVLGGGGGKMMPDDKRKIRGLRDMMEMCRDQAAIAHLAVTSLVNLSDTLSVARHLMEEDFLVWLVSYTTNTTSVLSALTSMLLSNLTSHTSLVPVLARLSVPIVPLPLSTKEPKWYLPAGISGSSTVHPDYRDPSFVPPNKEAGQEDERPVEAVRALVQAFEDGAAPDVKEGKGKRKGECHFLASVFANLSTIPSTRATLLTPFPPFPTPSSSSYSHTIEAEPLLAKIAPFTSHPDTIRRGGALGCIKNIALDRACHAFLLASEDDRVRLPPTASVAAEGVLAGQKRDAEGEGKGTEEDEEREQVEREVGESRVVRGVDVLPAVLGPLMGGEEYDIDEMDLLPATLQFMPPEKQREVDPVLRTMCVEILLLLSTTFTGRETLRKRGAYYVVRELHKWEQDQSIRDAIERLVGLLQGEEGHQTKADQVDELVKGIKGTSVAGAATGAVAGVETSTVSQDDGSDSELDVMEV